MLTIFSSFFKKKQDPATYNNTVPDVLSQFHSGGKGLGFTHELPLSSILQFLDINITFLDDPVCW